MTQAPAAVVRKQVVVEAPLERAFTVFTDGFGDFKPREHNLLPSPIAKTVFEPRVGGHIVDIAEEQGWPLYLDRYTALVSGDS